MKTYHVLLVVTAITAVLFMHSCESHTDGRDKHATHTSGDAEEHGDACDHDKEAQEPGNHDENDHAAHEAEQGVTLSDQAVALAGLLVDTVALAPIGMTIELPGEIGFNEDQVAHITPRYSGIAREVHKRLGEYVTKGEVMALVESNQSLSSYKVTAPIDGHIVEKHVTTGEYVSEERDMYVIANLATVWVNCEVYPKYADYVKTGQKIRIKAVGQEKETEGVISYCAPVYNEATRSAVARAVVSSNRGEWRPGTFIRASFTSTGEGDVPVVVKEAVQVLEDHSVLFVPDEHEANHFRPVTVVCGISDDRFVEIKQGVTAGERYVAQGAFELKAKIVTGSLGAHAGCSH